MKIYKFQTFHIYFYKFWEPLPTMAIIFSISLIKYSSCGLSKRVFSSKTHFTLVFNCLFHIHSQQPATATVAILQLHTYMNYTTTQVLSTAIYLALNCNEASSTIKLIRLVSVYMTNTLLPQHTALCCTFICSRNKVCLRARMTEFYYKKNFVGNFFSATKILLIFSNFL